MGGNFLPRIKPHFILSSDNSYGKNRRSGQGQSNFTIQKLRIATTPNEAPFKAADMENKSDYKRPIKRTQLIADIISSIFLILFLYTALSKLWDYENFRATLSSSPLLSPIAALLALLIPITELIIVVLLFIPTFRRWGFYASFVLITLFTGYLTYMILRTPDLPCSCGGVLAALSWGQHIFFNLAFILLSFTGIILYNRNKNRRSSPPP